MQTYNIRGKEAVISEIISRMMKEISGSDPCCSHSKNKRLISDSFPCDDGERDVNVSLENEDVDMFLDLCDAYDLDPEEV